MAATEFSLDAYFSALPDDSEAADLTPTAGEHADGIDFRAQDIGEV